MWRNFLLVCNLTASWVEMLGAWAHREFFEWQLNSFSSVWRFWNMLHCYISVTCAGCRTVHVFQPCSSAIIQCDNSVQLNSSIGSHRLQTSDSPDFNLKIRKITLWTFYFCELHLNIRLQTSGHWNESWSVIENAPYFKNHTSSSKWTLNKRLDLIRLHTNLYNGLICTFQD